MDFLRKYPVTLNELLMAPLVFRESWPPLSDLPWASAAVMRDVAEFGGHKAGAIRTAMSRMRASEVLEPVNHSGVVRYRLGKIARSVNLAVRTRFERPEGYTLAIFSFAADDTRERQLVRETLKSHGFQKLAQNVYVSGTVDTTEIERVVSEHGLAEHLFLFHCAEGEDPARDQRLARLFEVDKRSQVLARFETDLHAFLNERGVSNDEFARRYFAAGPIHYRITFTEEPPLPARCLPPDYPLERLVPYPEPSPKRIAAVVDYYRRLTPESQP